MGERLELSWERIREIPVEADRTSLHGVFFASLSEFFLAFLSERETADLKSLDYIVQLCLKNCHDYIYPEDALRHDGVGDILSVLLYLSLGIVYEEEEVARCRILELFIELYLLMNDTSVPDRQIVKDALYAHFYDYTRDFLSEWFEGEKDKSESNLSIHNPLFSLCFPFRLSSPMFTEEYEEIHRNDLSLILGERLLARLEQEWDKSGMAKQRYAASAFWSDSPHALKFNMHQKKLLREFRDRHFRL